MNFKGEKGGWRKCPESLLNLRQPLIITEGAASQVSWHPGNCDFTEKPAFTTVLILLREGPLGDTGTVGSGHDPADATEMRVGWASLFAPLITPALHYLPAGRAGFSFILQHGEKEADPEASPFDVFGKDITPVAFNNLATDGQP